MAEKFPRLLIAGLSGDSGKTITSLSLLTALRQKGLVISVFKKGPDYIDSAWLGFMGKSTCRNLDTYLTDPATAYESFTRAASKSGISIIEGNRGIFDGKDISGTYSTAGLAKILQAPVVLVVNCKKSTLTIAALINGCQKFDPDVEFIGVILNNIAGERHKNIITESIEKYCHLPVLGAIPKLNEKLNIIPNRHLGLVTPEEFQYNSELEILLHEISEKYLDIDRIIDCAEKAIPLKYTESQTDNVAPKVKIGYFKDSIFSFYYPENLEALEINGAELIKISSLKDQSLPDIDALYIGGGFPETQAQLLVDNASLSGSVRKAAVSGMPIYAECGGLIYLSRSLSCDNKTYPMAGVFPIDLKMNRKPVGHGYTMIEVDCSNPYFKVGTQIRGHEFHYTSLVDFQIEHSLDSILSCMSVSTGVGLGGKRDGLLFNNTIALYTHIHASGVKDWADSMIHNALKYKINHKHNNNFSCSDNDNLKLISENNVSKC